MSDWPTLNASVNALMVATFGVPAIFTPQDGAGGWLPGQPIRGIVTRPAMPEDFPPGFGSGTTNLRFWINFEAISPPPQHGDQLTFNGVTYVLQEVEADIDGGATLKLRAI